MCFDTGVLRHAKRRVQGSISERLSDANDPPRDALRTYGAAFGRLHELIASAKSCQPAVPKPATQRQRVYPRRMLAIFRRDLFSGSRRSGSTGAFPPHKQDAAPGRNKNEPHRVSHDICVCFARHALCEQHGLRPIHRRRHQDRRPHRHGEPLCRQWRPRLRRRGQARGRGFRRCREGHEGRDHFRRSPEQTRCRIEHRQFVVRRRQSRHDHRHSEFRRRPRGK